MSVKHKFNATNPDGADPLKVRSSNWNDEHIIDLLSGSAGPGIDGALHFDGVAIPSGSTLSGSTYTLTRCIFPSTMIVDVGIAIDCNNSRIFVAGTLTNNGHIHNDGAAAALAVPGGAKAAAFFAATQAGGAGAGTATGSGSNGGASAHVPPIPFSQGTGAGGTGGTQPGSGTAGTVKFAGGGGGGTQSPLGQGGNGGGVSAEAAATMPTLEDLLAGRTAARTTQFTGGSGGGGGGVVVSTGPGCTGGAGGAGAGVLAVVCGELAGTGTITCKGGNGSDASVPASGASGGGGGGGGGGGLLIVAYGSNTGPNTFSVSAGVGGVGHQLGGFTAVDAGGNGVAGQIVRINLNNDGT